MLAWAAGTAVASLGLTPGGLGVVEAPLSSALIATGLVGSTAIAAVLVYRIVSLWLVLAVGGLTLLALGGPRYRRRGPGRPGPGRLATGAPAGGGRKQAPAADGQQPGDLVEDPRVVAHQHAWPAAVHRAQDRWPRPPPGRASASAPLVAADLRLRRGQPGARRSRCARHSSDPARVHVGHADAGWASSPRSASANPRTANLLAQ